MSQFYEEVYSQDFDVTDRPHGWIQWKGTSVCIDLHCSCGHLGHVDGDYFYYYECPACGTKYGVGQNVALIPLTDMQIAHVDGQLTGFQTDSDMYEEREWEGLTTETGTTPRLEEG